MKIPAFEPIDLSNEGEKIELELFKIIPNPEQPRKVFNEEALKELASSIKEHGIIQPILVKKIASDKFYIIAGERRWRAAKMVGLISIPVIVKGRISDDNSLYLSLIENLQRENLNPIEEAEAFNGLIEKFHLTHEQIAEKVGKSRSEISNKIRLLNLRSEVREMLRNNLLSYGHAKVLLSFDEQHQIKIAEEIVNNLLTVRDIENLAKNYTKPNKINNEHKISASFVEKANLLSKIISNCLLAKVKIIPNSKGQGRAVIYFNSLDEIERLIDKLEK